MKKIKNFFFHNINNKQTIVKNTFWLFTSEALSRLLKMFLIIYAARVLGVNGWGVFSYALSVGSLLMIFADIGISGLVTREIIQEKENYKTFIFSALFLKIIILLISTLFVIFIGKFISNISEAKILFPTIAAILFFDSMRDLGFAINRASEKMEREMIVKILMSITILVLGIIFLKINPVPESITTAYAIGGAVGFFVIFIIVKKEIRKLYSKIDRKACNLVLKTTLPFAVIALIETIMGNTDIFMLGLWKNSTEIGLYASAQRIQQFILMVPAMFATATFPIMSRLIEDKEKFRDIFEKIMSFIMIIGIPLAIGGVIFSSQIIHLVFGPAYFGAIPILQIFMIMFVVSFPLIFISNAIFTYNKQKKLMWASSFGIITNILLNLILIPKLGAFGSAIATLASTTIIVVIIWNKMKKINNFEILSKLKKSMLSTLFMILSILILKHFELNVILNIIISFLVYFGSLIILKESVLKEIKSLYKY